MRIAVFGATGRTGRQVVARAGAAGHRLAVLARDPGKLDPTPDPAAGPAIDVVRGDVRDPAAVARVVADADAVIVALGPTKDAPPAAQTAGGAGSGLEWTVVRPPVLTDGPYTGTAVLTLRSPGITRVGRADLAAALLAEAAERRYVGQAPFVAPGGQR